MAVEKQDSRRNVGVDFLRIVSMWMIAMLHVLGQGGVLTHAQPGGANYYLAWLLEIAAYCAVNCFALISGYVSIGTKFKLSRIILLWFQVEFYSLVISAAFWAAGLMPLTRGDLVRSFFPVLSNRWWYVTSYFGLVFFTPFLQPVIEKAGKRTFGLLVFAIFVILSVAPMFSSEDLFGTDAGYSMLWLGAMYFVGAYLRKYPPLPRIRKLFLPLYFACILLVFLFKLLLERLYFAPFPTAPYANLLVKYTSPLIVGAAAFLLLFLSRLRFPVLLTKITAFFSPLAFGVYLIHVHPSVWTAFLNNRFLFLATANPLLVAAMAPLAALCIFIVCALVDWLRNALFKLLHLPTLAGWLDRKLTALSRRFFKDEPVHTSQSAEQQ